MLAVPEPGSASIALRCWVLSTNWKVLSEFILNIQTALATLSTFLKGMFVPCY